MEADVIDAVLKIAKGGSDVGLLYVIVVAIRSLAKLDKAIELLTEIRNEVQGTKKRHEDVAEDVGLARTGIDNMPDRLILAGFRHQKG